MATDFTDDIEFAQQEIADNGRAVTLIQFEAAAADPAKPWEGSADPRGNPAASLPLFAVFVQPSSLAKLGKTSISDDLAKRSEQIAMVAPGATADLTIFNTLQDTDGSFWKISGIEELRPNEQLVIGYVGVSR